MKTVSDQVDIQGLPPYVASWSCASIPGFVAAVVKRWQRDYGDLPSQFLMVLCPKVEVDAIGGLPERVRMLTNARQRLQHFTGCHKPYVVLFNHVEDDSWRVQVQQQLAWSEAYRAEIKHGMIRLEFIDAMEDL
jgi:hypothetical protein